MGLRDVVVEGREDVERRKGETGRREGGEICERGGS
jgi:hypothetical protein